jgi:hypothetical protein
VQSSGTRSTSSGRTALILTVLLGRHRGPSMDSRGWKKTSSASDTSALACPLPGLDHARRGGPFQGRPRIRRVVNSIGVGES